MKIDTGELTLAYEDTGRGPPVLFIHGYPLGRRMWRPQLEALLGSMRLIVPDLRGHGDSEAPEAPYTIAMHADDCIDLLDGLEIDQPVIVVGISMGGYIALELQRAFPERVAGLVLVSTRAGADSDEAKTKRNEAIALAETSGVSAVVASMLPKMMAPASQKKDAVVKGLEQVMLKTSLQGVVGDLHALRDRIDSTPFLQHIDVPTLVIHGADDALIPVSEGQALAAGITDAQLNVMADCGHLPNVEQPQAFNRAINAFVQFVANDEETQH